MKLVQRLLELLYPPRCVFCHRFMDSSEEMVCPRCLKTLPFAAGAGGSRALPHIERCVVPLYYEGTVRDALLRYKFGSLTGYASVFGKYIAKSVDENAITCDIITWTPLSRRRLRQRGYDQARLLAEEASRLLNTPCMPLLKKTLHTPAQSGTGGAEKRRANVAGVYEAVPPGLNGQSVLIIDDVVTTGATLSECARVLKAAGAGKIYAAAFAGRRE